MIFEPSSQPEQNQPQQPAEQQNAMPKPVEQQPVLRQATPQEMEKAKAQAKSFGENLKKKKEEYQEKIQKAFNIVESKGSFGQAKAKELAERQKNRIEAAAQNKLKEYNQLLQDQRQARRDILLNEAGQEFEQIFHPVELIINYVRGVDRLDDKEMVRLEAFLDAEAKMKVNPENEKLFLKILSHEKITNADFDYIFDHCQIVPPGKIDQQPKQVFEASQVGAIIGAMSDSQKMEFSRYLIKSKYPSQNEKVRGMIEAFYTHQVLSTAQIENLYSDMPAGLSTYFKALISNPEFLKRKNEYEKFLQRQEVVLQGRGAGNPLNKLWGMPGLYLLATLWGSATAMVNLGVNFNSKDIPGSIKNFFGGWGGIGLLTAVGGGMGIGNVLSPSNPLGAKLHEWLHPSSIEVSKEDEEKGKLRDPIYYQFGRNPELPKFLEKKTAGNKTVFETLIAEYNQQVQKKVKEKDINLLPALNQIKAGGNTELNESLQKGISYSGGKAENFIKIINDLFRKFKGLKVEDNSAFETFYGEYKKSQGLT